MSNTFGKPSQHKKRRTRSPFRSRDSHRLVVLEGEDRKSYLERTTEMIGIEFPAEYISRAEVLAVINQDDALCGGTMLVKRGPFRSIAGIPDDKRHRHESLNDQVGVAEINGLWTAPEMKGPFLSFQFWRLLIGHLIKSKKTCFLFTYDNGQFSHEVARAMAQSNDAVFWNHPALAGDEMRCRRNDCKNQHRTRQSIPDDVGTPRHRSC